MHIFPEKKDYPKDYFYHRTSSPTYRAYLEGCGLSTFDTETPPQFAWKKKIFGNFFWVVKWERVDSEPDVEYIKKMTWLRHAFIAWIPYSRTRAELPKLWRKLWFTDHFEETGFAELHRERSMYASWNDRAKRALKKFEKSGCTLEAVTPEIFAQAFTKTKVKHWHKSVYVNYYKKMVAIDATKVRQWIAYTPLGMPAAGLAVHDYLDTHSVHLVAFTDQKYYDTQAGTGVMWAWFRDSHEKSIKYLSVDHIRNRTGPWDQKWYTAFKENFITTRLSFREAYFRFF
jgi:hypothetical protein